MLKKKIPVIILGTHLFAEEVADLLRDLGEFELAGFCENWDRARAEAELLDHPVYWIDELLPFSETHQVVCAIGTTQRLDYIRAVEGMGFDFCALIHPSARIAQSSHVGSGSIVSAGVIIAAQTRIGRHTIINRGCLIGHHTRIGDCVTISPGANIAGKVKIGDQTYIGMGAIVLDRVTLGNQVVVGAGAVVTRDVPDNVQVMGIPARITKRGIQAR